MSRFAVLATLAVAALTVCVFTSTAGATRASSTAWVPGTSYYVSESEMENTLETKFDFATCLGISRFGKHEISYGEDQYVMFSCSIERGQNISCTGMQVKATKGSSRDYLKPKLVTYGSC